MEGYILNNMQIRAIDTSICRERRRFVQFPFALYYQTPLWVPPILSSMAVVLDRDKHPFYQHSDAQFFVAEENGQVVGRLAVLHHKPYCEYHHEATAFFYYFESIDDQQVAGGLFSQAEEWARQQGCTLLYGPRGFLRSDCAGQLIQGFDLLPAVGITYNMPYYDRLISTCGFTKETDYLSGTLTEDRLLPKRVHEISDRVKRRGNFWIKTFTSIKEVETLMPKIEAVHHDAFKNNLAYCPSTKIEFEMLVKNIMAIADPALLKAVMKGDEIAGFIIAYPNISKALQRTKGRIYPFGWFDLLLEKKRTRVIDINGVGLLPQYQGLGNNALLYVEIEKTLLERGSKSAEIIQVDERNFRSKSDMENMGVIFNKTHRVYRKPIQ
jgi:GNAT superfamily N-acetyltransferase